MGNEWSGKLSELLASANSWTPELLVPRETIATFRIAEGSTCGFISHISYGRKSKRSAAQRKQEKQCAYNVT